MWGRTAQRLAASRSHSHHGAPACGTPCVPAGAAAWSACVATRAPRTPSARRAMHDKSNGMCTEQRRAGRGTRRRRTAVVLSALLACATHGAATAGPDELGLEHTATAPGLMRRLMGRAFGGHEPYGMPHVNLHIDLSKVGVLRISGGWGRCGGQPRGSWHTCSCQRGILTLHTAVHLSVV